MPRRASSGSQRLVHFPCNWYSLGRIATNLAQNWTRRTSARHNASSARAADAAPDLAFHLVEVEGVALDGFVRQSNLERHLARHRGARAPVVEEGVAAAVREPEEDLCRSARLGGRFRSKPDETEAPGCRSTLVEESLLVNVSYLGRT